MLKELMANGKSLNMIIFLILTLLSLNINQAEAIPSYRVIDGDTIEIKDSNAPISILKTIKSHRLHGIDTPEIKGKCEKERELALKAKYFTQNFITLNSQIYYHKKLDKYGRFLIDIKDNNKDLATELVVAGLAVYYEGETKYDWCK
jgi:endonuclease YncB( thermonuclease family)